MFVICEVVDSNGNTLENLIGFVVIGRVIIGLRLRKTQYGGDVSFIFLHFAFGIGW